MTDEQTGVEPLDADYTMAARLCDDDGMVSYARVDPPNPFAADLTYYAQLNHLRRAGGHEDYRGDPFPCTGHAHLAREHIRCTSLAHGRRANVVPLLRLAEEA